MKIPAFPVLFILVVTATACSAAAIDDVYGKPPMTGYLNFPFGTVLEVVGDISVSRINTTSTLAEYSLDVKSINGKDVGRTLVMPIVPSPAEKYENIPLGKAVRVKVYETGGYTGIPDSIQEKWQDYNYSFRVWCVYISRP